MGKKRAYSALPSISSGDRCRGSLPGLALLLGMGAGGGPWGPQATGLMPAALGRTPHSHRAKSRANRSMSATIVTGVLVPETRYKSDTRSLLNGLIPPVYISSLSPSLYSVP